MGNPFRFAGAWALFAAGHMATILAACRTPLAGRAYQRLMAASTRVQGRSAFGPWSAHVEP